jgi:hypothetical protein
MMSSESFWAFMDARNPEDAADAYDDGDDIDRVLPADEPYGAFGYGWTTAQDCFAFTDEDEEALYAHSIDIYRAGFDSMPWNHAFVAVFEERLTGCLDSGLLEG